MYDNGPFHETFFEDFRTFHQLVTSQAPELVERFKVNGEFLEPTKRIVIHNTEDGENVEANFNVGVANLLSQYINSRLFEEFKEKWGLGSECDGIILVNSDGKETVSVLEGNKPFDINSYFATVILTRHDFERNNTHLPFITFSDAEKLELFSIVDSIVKTDGEDIRFVVFKDGENETDVTIDLENLPLNPGNAPRI